MFLPCILFGMSEADLNPKLWSTLKVNSGFVAKDIIKKMYLGMTIIEKSRNVFFFSFTQKFHKFYNWTCEERHGAGWMFWQTFCWYSCWWVSEVPEKLLFICSCIWGYLKVFYFAKYLERAPFALQILNFSQLLRGIAPQTPLRGLPLHPSRS